MISKLLKPLLIVVLLSSTYLTSYSQFKMDLHQGAVDKGKPDSVIATHYNMLLKSDIGRRQLTTSVTTIYNKKGQAIKSSIYSNDANPDMSHVAANPTKLVILYDDKGNLKKEGAPGNKVIYEYPAKGVVYVKHYRNDKLSTADTIKLDASGKIIEDDCGYFGGGKQYKKYYRYNSKGFLTEDNFNYTDGSRQTRLLYSYDDNDNLSKTVNVYPANTITNTYTYDKFDKHHNWQVKNMYTDGKLTSVIKRRITYYK